MTISCKELVLIDIYDARTLPSVYYNEYFDQQWLDLYLPQDMGRFAQPPHDVGLQGTLRVTFIENPL